MEQENKLPESLRNVIDNLYYELRHNDLTAKQHFNIAYELNSIIREILKQYYI